ncbi:MAG: extracellular solute-binding protein [Chloroflexi bacterium]|nr:extracellular solute-binding protein [Chloroflexota bacterium]MCY3938152.1 extracellular solute-binding protein [Chloroflexota bacterium]
MNTYKGLTRRKILRSGLVGGAGLTAVAALAGCNDTQVVVETRIHEVIKEVPVERVVTRIVERQEVVEVERVVVRQVEVEKVVTLVVEEEKVVTRIVEAMPKPRDVTIVAWNANWGELYNDLMMNLARDFEAAFPHVKVDYRFIPRWEEKLLASVAGGDPPDTTYTSWVAHGNLAFLGVFQPLDSFARLAGITRDRYIGSMWDSSTYQGRLYALPGGADFIAVFRNQDLYEEVGLEEGPATQDELIEHSLKLLSQDGLKITRIGWDPQWRREFMGFLNGGEFWDEETQSVTPDHPGIVGFLERFQAYSTELDFNRISAFWQDQPGSSKPGSPFALGKAAYLSTGFWARDPLDKHAADVNYSVSLLPSATGAAEERAWDSVQGWMYGIPTGARHPEEAWEFMKFGFFDNSARMAVNTLNGPTVLAQQQEWIDEMLERIGPGNRIARWFDFFTGLKNKGEKHWPAIPIGSFYRTEWGKAAEKVFRGLEEPAESMANVKKIATDELIKVRRSRA